MSVYIVDVVDNRNMQRAIAMTLPDDYTDAILRNITITNAAQLCGGFNNVKRARLIRDGHQFVCSVK